MPSLLSATAAKALGGPVETSLRLLLREYGYEAEGKWLAGLRDLSECFEVYGLKCIPPIGQGGLEEPRVLTATGRNSVDEVLAEIAGQETASVEFKSSLVFDWRRFENDPGRPIPDYRSDGVIKAALKSVAGFANSGGGTLYLGVTDGGDVCGLENDFVAANPKKPDFDGWDLHFRSLIKARFNVGDGLNAYVRSDLFELHGKPFVRVAIAPRHRMTFLRSEGEWELFIRTGTSTISIPFCEIEEHFALQKLY